MENFVDDQSAMEAPGLDNLQSPAASPTNTPYEGLNLISSWANQVRAEQAMKARSEVAQNAVKLWQAGDKKGALTMMGYLNPEAFTKSAIAQTEAPEIARSKAQAELDVDTAAGQNKAQLLDKTLKSREAEAEARGMQRGLEKKVEKEDKQSTRNDNWSTRVWSEIKSSQDFKNYQDYKIKENTLLNATKNPSAYGDIGTIFSFMKLLDPQSVVRESEYATAANAGSLLTRVKNAISKAEKGEILTKAQREDLATMTKHLGSVYKGNYESLVKPIRVKAKRLGVPMDEIDPFHESPSSLPPEIQGAQDWLEKNPNDPNAPKVREKLKAMGY